MLRVALTGGIATGKSYVRARVAARGVPTVDADAIVHALFSSGSNVTAEVARRFGAHMVLADRRVDRRALGPLLFETRHEGEFDRVIVVACSPDEQVRRVMRRDHLDEAAAVARLAAQWPIADKVRRATDVVETGESFEATDRQVDAICRAVDEVAGGSGSFGL